MNDVSQISGVVQTVADVAGTGAALVGLEPLAGALFTVSAVAGAINIVATCTSAVIGAGASGRDCIFNGAISAGTISAGKLLAPGYMQAATRRGVATRRFDRLDRVVQGSLNSFGDLLSWERGWKFPDPQSSGCNPQPEWGPAS